MKNNNVAISTFSNSVYSETFIQEQIINLDVKLVLYGGWIPRYYNNNELIKKSKKLKLIIFKLINFIFNTDYYTSPHCSIVKLLEKYNIGVLIAQYGLSAVELLPICKRANVDLIVHFHGFDASIYEIVQKNLAAYQEVFAYAKKIIVVSSKMKERIINMGCDISKVSLVYYGPNPKFFSCEPKFEFNTFFSLGRFVDKKAPYLTILAFNEVLKKYPECILKMGGTGELLNSCKKLVSALNIDNNVLFLGVLDREMAIYEMEQSIAFIQHSIVACNGDREGTPLAILEAQAASLPVISTFHEGIEEVVLNGETGYLVKELDIVGMHNAMIDLIENKKLAMKLGKNGRSRILEKFTLDSYINKLINIINE